MYMVEVWETSARLSLFIHLFFLFVLVVANAASYFESSQNALCII